MRLLVNALSILAIFLLALPAHGKRTDNKGRRPDNSRPTVVVMDIRVNSDNPKVQEKISELTAKVRDKISEQTTSCNVIRTKKMRQLSRQHRKQISNCYDDCGVEFGILIKAEFVITGYLEPSTTEILAVVEIRDTRTRNVIATRKVRGANYFELENALLSAVRRIVKPLNNVVLQARDDEVVAVNRSEETAAEPGPGSTTAATGGSAPESEYLAKEEEEEEEVLTPMGERWLEARKEPPLVPTDDENELLGLGVGINAGYSLNVSRNRHLQELYQPVVHLGFQAYYQLHPLLQIALVGDMDFLSGKYYADEGFDYLYDDDLEVTSQSNQYDFSKYNTIGIRPTIRLTAPVGMAELFAGVGMGFNYVSAKGTWLKRRYGRQYFPDQGVPWEEVSETVFYYFELSGFNFYAAFDFGGVVRVLDKRLGVGVLIQYKLPSMWRSGTKAKAKPNLEASETQDPPFTTPSTQDTIHSPIRHLDSLNLLTFGLVADWRF